ncbi:MAG: hypothetical protein H6668_13140 [Ardenticatenaceae bacterium]|nr:hypothetical protein [Ardenticatenaceae bacterium]
MRYKRPTSGQRAAASGSVAVAQAEPAVGRGAVGVDAAGLGATASRCQQVEVGVEQAQTAVAQAQAGVWCRQKRLLPKPRRGGHAQAGADVAGSWLKREPCWTATFDGTVGQINTGFGVELA